MDYIHDTTAFELSTAHGNPMSIPPAYADHYYAQLADTMAQLASLRFLEFFAANIRNPHTRRVYARAAEDFLGWCADAGVPSITAVRPVHVCAARGLALLRSA